MSVDRVIERQGRLVINGGASIPSASPGGKAEDDQGPGGPSQLRLRVIERVAIVRFTACEFLVGEAITRGVIGHLRQVFGGRGCTRLLLNLDGVRYLSSEMVMALADLHAEVDRRGGRVQLCGLDPLLRDVFRLICPDRMLDICTDEAEALGLLIR
jgi:anti-anti-sigma factor